MRFIDTKSLHVICYQQFNGSMAYELFMHVGAVSEVKIGTEVEARAEI